MKATKAIVSAISIGSGKGRILSLQFMDSMFGGSSMGDVRFEESKLGIVGLSLGDELNFYIQINDNEFENVDVVENTPEPTRD